MTDIDGILSNQKVLDKALGQLAQAASGAAGSLSKINMASSVTETASGGGGSGVQDFMGKMVPGLTNSLLTNEKAATHLFGSYTQLKNAFKLFIGKIPILGKGMGLLDKLKIKKKKIRRKAGSYAVVMAVCV